MQVHQVIDNSRLKISLDVVDDDLAAHVDQFDICQVFLRDRLIGLSVVDDSRLEVLDRLFRIHVLVIRGFQLDRHDVMQDQCLIFADRLNKHDLDVVLLAFCHQHLSSGAGGVGCIIEGNDTLLLLEPVDHIFQGFNSSLAARPLTVRVSRVEKVMQLMCTMKLSTIVSDVEHLGGNAEPLQIAAD